MSKSDYKIKKQEKFKHLTRENSYNKDLNYIDSLHNDVIDKAFKNISKEEWIESTLDYLAHNHKENVRYWTLET